MPAGMDAVPGCRVRQARAPAWGLLTSLPALPSGEGDGLGAEELGQQDTRGVMGDTALQQRGLPAEPVQGA